MTADRPYRRARPVHEALAELERLAGTQFDPVCVDALALRPRARDEIHPQVTPPDAEEGLSDFYNHIHSDRRAAHPDGRARRLRPPPRRRLAARDARERPARAASGRPEDRARRDAHAHLRNPLHRAAEAARDEAPARLLVLDPRPRPLPRQRVLPADERRRRVPADPGADQDARGAPDARAPLRAGRQAARPRARDRPDRLR